MSTRKMNPELARTVRVALGAGLVSTLVQASPANLGAQATKGVHVCVGTDNVIRYTSGDRCPGGQRMYRLAEVEDEVGLAKERDEPTSAVVADLKARIDFLSRRVVSLEKDSPDVVGDLKGKVDLLTRRIANLESEATKRDGDPRLARRVTAPFEVVDKAGNPLFVVADVPHASVARRGRFQLARSVGDNTMSLVVSSAAGKQVVGLGDVADGGAFYLGDQAGAVRMFGSGGTGLMLHNKSSTGIIHLKAGEGGAGQFWLYDESGAPMVAAGTLSEFGGVGIVRVGPNMKCVPLGTLRVPDCIRGRPPQ